MQDIEAIRRDVQACDDWLTAYIAKNGNGVPKEAIPEQWRDTDAMNAKRSALEVHDFKNDPPDRYVAYISHGPGNNWIVTTWTGDYLGTVSRIHKSWNSRRWDTTKFYSFSAVMLNGMAYNGIAYGGPGMYCRIWKKKN